LSVKPGHFQPADGLLLARYSECAAMASEAAARLADEGPVGGDGKPSAWLAVHVSMTKAMQGLSHRLRLSPQGRSPSNPTRPAAPVSYYDRMRMEAAADDEVEQN
jgi:hypothetical protein